MKVGILTGGGDCPGLNAVIRAVVRKGCFHYEDEFVGFLEGWRGLVEDKTMPLDLASVGGILPRGGTILRTSRTNPAKKTDGLDKCIATLKQHQVEALIAKGLAARIIVQRNLPLDDLEAALHGIEEAVKQDDLRKVVESVQHFHIHLLEKSGNPVLAEHGRRLVVPLYAFTLMRALAKNLDPSPWAKQLPMHRLIIDVIRLGDPQVAEQTLIHVTNSFLDAALTVWAH